MIPARFQHTLTRLVRWEYWPAWAIYLPIIPHYALLALRYRGLTLPTAVNPAFPLSGLVGESKSQIIDLLPPQWVIPTASLPSTATVRDLESIMRQRNWSFPLIFKPDVGERGSGVKFISSPEDAHTYLECAARDDSFPVLAQTYHPGPFEAGIFYIRDPHQSRGSIFSITEKVFATVTGDGDSSLRDLILQHPRHALQASVFLNRLGAAAENIPLACEVVHLNIAGNHCQGAMFLDGKRLWTQALEDCIDQISRSVDGFYFGRFDVRYTDPAAFARGESFAIVELNGLLSESTNIYDPSYSFLQGQRILRAQWSRAFAIAASNRANGTRVASLKEIFSAIGTHRKRRTQALSD